MRMSEWLVLVGVMAVPLFACSSSDSGGGSGGYSGGTGGAVMGGTGGGTGGANTGGANTGGANTGGANTGGANTGGANTGGANTGGTGVGGGGTGGSTMQECTAALWRDAACGQCMETNCVGACEACLTNADCAAWAQCVFQCQDMACYDACDQNNPNGAQLGNAWIGANGCFGTACGDACGGGTGICDSGLTTNDPACDTCLGTNCCDVIKTCVGDSACSDCLTGAASAGCDTMTAYTNVTSCWTDQCGSACGGGGGICDSGLTTNDPACDTCLGTNCCDEVKNCKNDSQCYDCLTGVDTSDACNNNTNLQALDGCFGTNCSNECGSP